jgi:PKD repeat protein
MRRAGVLLLTLAGLVASSDVPALAALPVTSNPQLQLARTIRTTPFVGSAISMKDSEGSAYVASDNSLWLAGDNDRAIYEVNPADGTLKRKIDRVGFEAATLPGGGGPEAGPNRSADFESMAYDGTYLYVFSGVCCVSTVLPTVFRLARDGSGAFQVESYQPLVAGSDFTASAWNANESTLYVAKGRTFNGYNYVTNTLGPPVQVPNLIGILGIGFSGPDLFAVTNAEVLVRVDWPTKSIMNGWTFDLTSSGVLDSRAVELIGDQFYVSDGYDARPAGDPLAHAVFVYDVLAGSAPTPPTASFTATPMSGDAPLTVSFTNTSSGDPTPTFNWTFDDGGTSTAINPSHTYTSAGTYTVTLAAHNSAGDDTDTAQINVTEAPPSTNLVGNPGFDVDTSGWGISGSGLGVQLTRVTPGHDGAAGGAAKLNNGSTRKRKCVLNDQPNWVTTTQAGTYTASIWVRDDSPFGKFKLMLKETGGALNGSLTTTVTMTANWQLVSVSYTVKSPGTSTLDLQAFVPKNFAPPGTCFYADDVSILKS